MSNLANTITLHRIIFMITQWVVDYNKDNFIEADKPKPNLLPPTSFVDNELMKLTLTNYGMNPLYIYLSGMLGKDETSRIFQLYHVGTSKEVGRFYCLLAN